MPDFDLGQIEVSGASGFDALFKREENLVRPLSMTGRVKVASLKVLHNFVRLSSDTLIHKSDQDLWALKKEGDGYFIERLFDDNGEPLKSAAAPAPRVKAASKTEEAPTKKVGASSWEERAEVSDEWIKTVRAIEEVAKVVDRAMYLPSEDSVMDDPKEMKKVKAFKKKLDKINEHVAAIEKLAKG